MKTLSFLLLLLATTSLWARPVVLVTYYDPFNKAPLNNSETVAKLVAEKLKDSKDVAVKLCPLNTIYDKAWDQQEACIKALPEEPKLVLGLGEAFCEFKVELVARNFDLTTNAPDNAGVARTGRPIIPGATYAFGFTYPLADMYCALHKRDRKLMNVSNNAGSFVCNNTAYQMTYNYPETTYGFIHVPSYHCPDIKSTNYRVVDNLSDMILTGAKVESPGRLPVFKKELKYLRKQADGVDECRHEFYERARGIDEKSFWSKIKPL